MAVVVAAEMVAVVLAVTLVVLTVNVPVVEPAAIVKEAGTVAFDCPARVTTIPSFGAGAFIVTLPVELLPPLTVVGDKVSDKTVGGLMVRVAVSVTPLSAAEIVALV